MATQDLSRQLRSLPDIDAQQRFLEAHACFLDDRVAEALKEQADEFLRSNIQLSLDTSLLLLTVGEITGNPLHTALGLLAQANALAIGLGDYDRAIELYKEATEIYRRQGRVVEEAKAQVGKIWPLACLGRSEEALATGLRASAVLESHAQWRPLATLTMNLAIVRGRMGEDAEALALFDHAGEQYRRLGADGEAFQPWIEQNRSIVLRNLGRFAESMQASAAAWQGMEERGQFVEAARARQNLAVTYFVQGRYNEALSLLDRVRDVFMADGRVRDAVLVDLYASDCLLRLGRYGDVLDKSEQTRSHFAQLGAQTEAAQSLLNQAVAYEGLSRYSEALASLAQARQIFVELENQTWAAVIDLETAGALRRQGHAAESLALAQSCVELFNSRHLAAHEAQANLVAAQAAADLGDTTLAWNLAEQTQRAGPGREAPWIAFQCHRLLGVLHRAEGNLDEALAEYDSALAEIERLRSQIMVEYRPGFLEDKQGIYGEAIDISLAQNRAGAALAYAERAKSRALVDLLAHRVELDIRPRDPSDSRLLDRLTHLRAERARLYRRLESGDDGSEDRWGLSDAAGGQPRQKLLSLENDIQDLWHRLLIRNADYAHEAALLNVRVEPVQPYLEPGDLLVEYFEVQGRLLAFLVTSEDVSVRRLPVDLTDVATATQRLWLNLRTVPRSPPGQMEGLRTHAHAILQKLYMGLMQPFEEALSQHCRVIVVPHGQLHYVPFHALYDGAAYLVEGHEVSYLPSASVLRYCRAPRTAAAGCLVMGHSNGGRLPFAVQEARAVSGLLGVEPFLEEEATLERLRDTAHGRRLLHIAAHGEYRADEPLFSGLNLAGGLLTTLDIFGLNLSASLVTLSACHTGRSVVTGGDELLGLMRAFLYAGATSLILGLWTAEDRSAAQLMEAFYAKLTQGWSKGAALRHAQMTFIRGETDAADVKWAHPYFWAPMFLVGHWGAL